MEQGAGAGLADLLEGAGAGVLGELPVPQRRALEVAVRRAEPGDQPPEPLAIAAGLLGVFRAAAEARPVLVAVDDLPWLDSASAGAVVFAARRLAGADVRFLVARRAGRPTGLEQAAGPAGVTRVELGPLSFGAISGLLAARLTAPLPRRVARQVFDTSGGNPLFALELGRAVAERGVPEIGAGLPVPEVLGELFGARVAALPPPVRRALLAVALSAGLTAEELAAVTDPLVVQDAAVAGVLAVDGGRVRAAHPLLAAAAAGQAAAAERRDLHAALGAVAGDPVLAARHRALAAPGPDAGLAGEVAGAAAAAAARGAVHDAAELAGHALRLTPPGDSEYDGRVLALARYLTDAGEHPRAAALLAGRIGTMPAPARAAAHLLLSQAWLYSVEEEHLAQAITDSAADPGLHAQALARRALLLAVNRVERVAEAEQVAGEALAAASSAGPDDQRRALVALAWARVLRGRAIDDLIAQSAGLPPGTANLYQSMVDRPAGVRLAFRGELPAAREVFQQLLAGAEQRGEARAGMVFSLHLCEVELRVGDTAAAARALGEFDQWTALEPEASVFRTRAQAMLAAVRGDPGRATALTATMLQASASSPYQWDRLEARRAAGVAALLARDPEQAAGSLSQVWEHTEREGVADPGAFPVAGDLAEALAETGKFAAAADVIGRLTELAAAQQHPWGRATADRSAAVVTLARGYDEAAAAQLAAAAGAYQALGAGWDAARALLVLGRAQRRAKKRAAARESLAAARAGFEQLGCPGWAQAAAAELDRVAGRRAGRGADPWGAAGRRAGGGGPVEPAGRRAVVCERVHGGGALVPGLRQARHRLPHPARPRPGPSRVKVRRPPGGQRPQVSGIHSWAAAPTVGRMLEFLAETYTPRGTAPCPAGAARAAADAAGPQGPAWFLGAVAVPEEETCFWLYQAPSAAAVHAAMTAAGLRPERISEAVALWPPVPAPGAPGTSASWPHPAAPPAPHPGPP